MFSDSCHSLFPYMGCQVLISKDNTSLWPQSEPYPYQDLISLNLSHRSFLRVSGFFHFRFPFNFISHSKYLFLQFALCILRTIAIIFENLIVLIFNIDEAQL